MAKDIANFDDVKAAQANVKGFVTETPTVLSQSFSKRLGFEIYLKKENEQRTGSFKIRGAYNKISSLSEAEKKAGVIACSAGNHAQGVALSAKCLGVQATIVMPENAPIVKSEATKDYGARVILHGDFYDQAADKARELEKTEGKIFIHPYEDPKVVAGQGTIGLEILEAVPDLECLFVPVGGGGLISGVALAAKTINPKIRIVGVQADNVASMAHTFKTGKAENLVTKLTTIADGIAVKRPSKLMYENYISKLVDEFVTVTDDEIAEAIALLMERGKTLVEGAGAVSVAAIINKRGLVGKKVCAILSGGNIDLNIISRILELGLTRTGRLVYISTIVSDSPGTLNRITEVLAKNRANVLQVHHERAHNSLHLMETQMEFLLETHNHHHVETIKADLEELGVRVLL